MPRPSSLRFLSTLLITTGLGLLVGCGGTVPRAIVKGKVSLGDKNLTAGTIEFRTKDNSVSGSGRIEENGEYRVTDAPVGDALVSITVPKVGAMMGKMPPGMMQGPKDGGMKMADAGAGPGPTTIDPKKIVNIPDKYSKSETSGLTFKVERGENTHNITLQP